ncbi:Peptidase A4 family domain containing protein [Amanita muscaria]
MIFGSLLTALLLTTAAFAAPEGAIARQSRSASRQSNPVRLLSGSTGSTAATNTSNVAYSSNWAGAVWDSYPANTFYKVTGTFTVPTPSAPNGVASIWVGIDGHSASCQSILQTGISMSYQDDVVTYQAWYEWLPDKSHKYIDLLDINAGDVVRLTVTALSTTSGTTLVENLTTGKSELHPISDPSNPLCLQNAEWIVEDYDLNGSIAPFCDFGVVAFHGASASLRSGAVINPAGALQVNIRQNSKDLTLVSRGGTPDRLTITYMPTN